MWRALHRNIVFGGPLPAELRNIAMSGWPALRARAIAAAFAGDPDARSGGCRRAGRRYGHCRQHRRRNRWRAERIARAAASAAVNRLRDRQLVEAAIVDVTCANRCR